MNTFVANFHDAVSLKADQCPIQLQTFHVRMRDQITLFTVQVLLYAKALNESIEEHGLGVKSNGSYIVSKMRNSTIKGK